MALASLFQIGFLRENKMLMTILLVVLVLMLIGAIPRWPHSRAWGYGPSGGITILLVILIVLLMRGGGW